MESLGCPSKKMGGGGGGRFSPHVSRLLGPVDEVGALFCDRQGEAEGKCLDCTR